MKAKRGRGLQIQTDAKWKSIPLDPSMQGFGEGLLGIEVLENYSFVSDGKKAKKRPLKESKTHNVSEEEPAAKKKKKKNVVKESKGRYVLAPKKVSEELEESNPDVDMSGWDDMYVDPLILKGLADAGYTKPTPIQREVLPAAIQGKMDVVGAAETGSGKTLAFAIPILNGILKQRTATDEDANDVGSDSEEDFSDQEVEQGCVKVVNDVVFDFDAAEPVFVAPPASETRGQLMALVLTPTRELAIQVKDHIVAAAKHTDIKTAVVVGGMAPQKQRRILARKPEIVVATPGRLWDLISEGDPHLSGAKNIRFLAIDETDRMVEKGHFEEFQQLLEMLNEDDSKKQKRQTFVFSATLSMVHDIPSYLLKKKKTKKLTSDEKLKSITSAIGVKMKRKVVDLTRKSGTAETLLESKIHCSINEKDFYLYYLFTQHPGRTLVFCNSIDCVRRLVNLFGYLRCSPLGLHAQMQQRQRLKNLDRFTKNPKSVLIATDVAARGLDIKDVQHVVHYQVPRTSEVSASFAAI